MEEETRIIFKGKVKDLDGWFSAMKKRYKDAYVKCVIEDFKTTE